MGLTSRAVTTCTGGIVISSAFIDPVCTTADGSIRISVTGGSPQYRYHWSNSDSAANIYHLTAGTYSVTVTDAEHHTATASIALKASTRLILPVLTEVADTCDGGRGRISVSTGGNGSAPYHYIWSNGRTCVPLTGLTVGTYSLTVTDSLGCTGSARATVSDVGKAIQAMGTVSPPLCPGTGGSIMVNASLGTSNHYSMVWSNGYTGDTARNLSSGTYSVTVNGTNNCKATATFAMPAAPAALMLNANIAQAQCAGKKGSISINPSGGTGPHYTALWSNGASGMNDTALSSGTYSVIVSDENSCSVSASYTISLMTTVALSGVVSDSICSAASSSIQLSPSGGTGPYTFQWSNDSTGSHISGLAAGSYAVTTTDANGCTATATFAVTSLRVVLSDSMTAPVCSAANGSIQVSAAGGSGPYTFLWSNNSTASFIGQLTPGTYTVTVANSNGCRTSGSYDLVASSPVVADVVSTNIRCDSSVGGTLLISSLTGAYYPWTITWSGPDSFTSSLNSLYHLSPGTYNLSVMDAHGCGTSGSYTLTSSGTFALAASVTNTTCRGGQNGAISLYEVGPYSTPNFIWSGPDGYASTVRSPEGLAAGVYYLTVTEPYGCTAVATDTVYNGQPLSVTYNATPVLCDSGTGGSLSLSAISNGTYPLTVSWLGPDGFSSTATDLYMLNSGTYTLSLMDAAGCRAYGSYQVGSRGSITASYETQMITCYGTNNGAVAYQSMVPYYANAVYSWTGSNNFSSSAQSISNLPVGSYNLELTGNFGCKAYDTFGITRGFDLGVENITNNYCPVPGRQVIMHPIAGDMSEMNGLHCASGISGQVQMVFTGSATYNGVMPGALPPSTVSGDTLTWNIPDFGLLNNDSAFFIYLGIDSAAIYGTEVCVYVYVKPDTGDYNASNNADSFCMTVIHAYDPNDKTAFPQGDIDTSVKEIVYTIQFQNTGTASAQNITILDTLDRNIDPQSFQLLAYSHQNNTVLNGNAINFSFNNINLPDTAVSQTASTGWVQYKVRLQDGLSPGTNIYNTAYIYFDLNPAIATHTTVNTISGKSKKTAEPGYLSSEAGIQLYPNPAQSFVSVNTGLNSSGGRIEMSNAAGIHCASYNMTGDILAIPVGQYAAGVYVLHFTAPDGTEDAKELIVEK